MFITVYATKDFDPYDHIAPIQMEKMEINKGFIQSIVDAGSCRMIIAGKEYTGPISQVDLVNITLFVNGTADELIGRNA